MMVAAAGAGGDLSLSPIGGANDAQKATGLEQTGGREQINEVIGDRAASSGQGVQARSVDVLSDGTIRDMVFMYLLDDKGNSDKGKGEGSNIAALGLAKEMYEAASQLQASSAQGSMGSNMGQADMSGGGLGGAGGGVIAR
jgi:hypothetical protein